MKIAIEQFARRFPAARLKPNAQVGYASSLIFRVPTSLPVLLR
jgi:hypothetical protein